MSNGIPESSRVKCALDNQTQVITAYVTVENCEECRKSTHRKVGIRAFIIHHGHNGHREIHAHCEEQTEAQGYEQTLQVSIPYSFTFEFAVRLK